MLAAVSSAVLGSVHPAGSRASDEWAPVPDPVRIHRDIVASIPGMDQALYEGPLRFVTWGDYHVVDQRVGPNHTAIQYGQGPDADECWMLKARIRGFNSSPLPLGSYFSSVRVNGELVAMVPIAAAGPWESIGWEEPTPFVLPLKTGLNYVEIHLDVYDVHPEIDEENNVRGALIDVQVPCTADLGWAPWAP